MRKDVFEVIDSMIDKGEKINYSKIARQYDCDYRTVKKYYRERNGDYKKRRTPRKVKKKVDGFEDIIKDKYLTHNSPAIAIFDLLKNEYGYTGSYTTIKYYCHNLKKEKEDEVIVRFESEPGRQCQIDWKEELILENRNGEKITFNIFLAILGYSRLKYIEFTFDRSQPTLFRCLTNCIRYFNGVPKEFLFDNMRTVVDQSRTQYDKPVYNDRFYQFTKDAGFIAKSCMAYRPQTKGKVETVARVMNRLKAYNNEFDDTDDLIEIVKQLNITINNEVHAVTRQKPIERFENEKEYLNPLPRIDILETYYSEKVLVRKVPRDCLITYKGLKYSVSPSFIGKSVTLLEENGNLLIYYSKVLISSHKITGKPITYNQSDYKLLLKRNLINSKDEDIERICRDNLSLFDKL